MKELTLSEIKKLSLDREDDLLCELNDKFNKNVKELIFNKKQVHYYAKLSLLVLILTLNDNKTYLIEFEINYDPDKLIIITELHENFDFKYSNRASIKYLKLAIQ